MLSARRRVARSPMRGDRRPSTGQSAGLPAAETPERFAYPRHDETHVAVVLPRYEVGDDPIVGRTVTGEDINFSNAGNNLAKSTVVLNY